MKLMEMIRGVAAQLQRAKQPKNRIVRTQSEVSVLDQIVKIMGKKEKQANCGNANAPLIRGHKEKKHESIRESVRIIATKEATTSEGGVHEGAMVKVILINEGLGNRRNMNYYGPEAIESAPEIFEGKPSFLDHPSQSEERDLPERRVRQKCGYFKNCHVELIESKKSCVGELHFDLSEDGEQAYLKACTALHYRDEFSFSESEYVGLSINADGEWEQRTMDIDGESIEVNYVTRFTEAMSCDIVTSPARGGRFLALVESAAGAVANQSKEVGLMKKRLQKSLEAARTALKKASKESEIEAMKKQVLEAEKLFEAFLKEAAKAAKEAEDDGEEESEDAESEDETESEGEGESEDAESEDDASGGDSHTTVTRKVVKKTGKAAYNAKQDEDESEADDAGKDDDDVAESKRVAIRSMAKEAGVVISNHRVARLVKSSLKEAKAEIAGLKWEQESLVQGVMKKMSVPTLKIAMTESGSESADGKDGFLAGCVK